MTDCCEDKACELVQLRGAQARTLKIVLAINASMFFVEFGAGIVARSTALMADSLDMLGDALVYAVTLFVLNRSMRWRAGAALFKAFAMLAFGLFVLGEVAYKSFYPALPAAPTMGAIGLLALAANSVCLWLLMRYRTDDLNMRSVWLCSRNDIVANIGVIAAAGAVWFTASPWPDIAIGLLIAMLFLHSAAGVMRAALREFRQTNRAKS